MDSQTNRIAISISHISILMCDKNKSLVTMLHHIKQISMKISLALCWVRATWTQSLFWDEYRRR